MVRDIGLGNDRLLPDYGANCLSSVPATLLSLFGIGTDRPRLPPETFEGVETKGVENVVLFLFDGFGFNEWKRQEGAGLVKLFHDRGRVTPITTVFPTTTSTALTTLATGRTPQEHGLIEWYLYLSELDMIVETLPFSPMGASGGDRLLSVADPRILFEGETIYKRMMEEDVSVHAFLNRRIAHSGYSSLVHHDSDVVPFSYASDLMASLRTKIEESRGPAFFYVYWSMVDTVEHTHGPNTEESRLEASMISNVIKEGLAGKLDESAARRTLFLATADHGQIFSPIEEAMILDDDPEVVRNLATSANGRRIYPWGAPRDVYMKLREGSLEATKESLSRSLGDKATVLRTSDAVGSGLFGTGVPSERFAERVGDLMVLPNGTRNAWYRHPEVEEPTLKGMHGGLHPDEMTIPFAAMRGSSLSE